MRQVFFKLGLKAERGYNTSRMKKRLNDFGIDFSHFLGQSWHLPGMITFKGQPLEEMLVAENKTKTAHLRKRLISEGYKKAKCEKCGRVTWNGEQISLELHHVNGVKDDNRIENLQILCPNCHAQTETYRAKNIRR